jgi:4-diphosphocytidyl-2-C-methyl-D-erythritol kinase
MSRLSLPAHAKINLWLRINGKRPDGFHAVDTRMCPIDIADRVDIELLPEGSTQLTCSDTTLPIDETNLALRALRAFEQRTGIVKAWRIHLDKHIPSGAGLGGGSSDAAAVLRGLNELSGSPLSLDDLAQIAASIGSDIPFFLHHRTCDATGRGELVTPIDFPHQFHLVLIKPPFGIPTPWAYKHWATSQPLAHIRYEAQPTPWGDMLNDLERPVFEKHYFLAALKIWLLAQPETTAALMSGSGSTMFAITKDQATAEALAQRAQDYCGETSWVRVTQTLA